jgi:D-glycero-alpha-D-manno-heptose-7-phosphate kinase
MIVNRTPYRISFFGGGTDYPAWYSEHGGQVLATTIDKYSYITCRYLPPFFEHRFCLVYSKTELVQTVDEIKHPAIREVLRYLSVDRGLEIHHDGDLPARSGMGSSSAFTVGLLHAVHALQGRMVGKEQLANESIHLEQNVLKETVGSQDQVLAAYGGFNHITFHPTGEISVRPITVSQQRVRELNSHLMLFYTGIKRTASNIAQSYVNNIDQRKRQLRIMKDLVEEGTAILNGDRDIRGFGELLHECWQSKRSMSSQVSNSDVDDIYERAVSAGAIGGKITGAGGGGFLLLFVEPDRQDHVRERLNELIYVPFGFEHSGSQIIFYGPQPDYSEEHSRRENQSVVPFRELTGETPSFLTDSVRPGEESASVRIH